MYLYVGQMDSDVTALDDRSVLHPEVLDQIVTEVMKRYDATRSTDARREDETQLWSSVRAGTGR